jgi:hypothetical protein
MNDGSCTGDLCANGVEELTIQELMLSAFDGAKGRDMDERGYLLKLCTVIPRNDWPPQIAACLDEILLPDDRRPKKYLRFVDLTKRSRGRPLSRETKSKQFWYDPNHVAAFLAFGIVKELRRRPHTAVRPYKVEISDGSKRSVHDEAVRRAVEIVGRSLRHLGSRKKVNVAVVRDLLRRGRTHPPDLSGDD